MTATQLFYPPRLVALTGGGVGFLEVEQDSADDIRCSAGLLCEVRPGQLPWAPGFGTTSHLGDTDPDLAAAEITAELADQEPRAPIIARVVVNPADNERTLRLRLGVQQ